MATKVYRKCDTDGNEHITWKEALLCGVPAKFHKEFLEHAGKDKELDRPEFVIACREHTSGLAELEDIDDHDHGDEFAQLMNQDKQPYTLARDHLAEEDDDDDEWQFEDAMSLAQDID